MKQHSKLRQNEQQESTQQQHSEQKNELKEFSSVEDMLRHDSAQTSVPPSVADRVNGSIANEPQQSPSWWKRLVWSFKAK